MHMMWVLEVLRDWWVTDCLITVSMYVVVCVCKAACGELFSFGLLTRKYPTRLHRRKSVSLSPWGKWTPIQDLYLLLFQGGYIHRISYFSEIIMQDGDWIRNTKEGVWGSDPDLAKAVYEEGDSEEDDATKGTWENHTEGRKQSCHTKERCKQNNIDEGVE